MVSWVYEIGSIWENDLDSWLQWAMTTWVQTWYMFKFFHFKFWVRSEIWTVSFEPMFPYREYTSLKDKYSWFPHADQHSHMNDENAKQHVFCMHVETNMEGLHEHGRQWTHAHGCVGV